MPIEIYKRKDNFFSINTLSSENLDNEFNNITNYINTNITNYINEIVNNRFLGSNNILLRNAFLINVGDGSLKWDFIKEENFAWNGTSLNKFELGVDNSLLVSDAEGLAHHLTATEDDENKVLMSIRNNTPKWDFVSNDNFEDRSITGDKIHLNSIPVESITGVLESIGVGELDGIKLKDLSITTDNVIVGGDGIGLTEDELVPAVKIRFPSMLISNMLPDNYITDHYDIIFANLKRDYTINGNTTHIDIILKNLYGDSNIGALLYRQWDISKFASDTIPVGFEKDFLVYTSSIKLNSINGERLHYFDTIQNKPMPEDNYLIDDWAIRPEHLTDALARDLGLI